MRFALFFIALLFILCACQNSPTGAPQTIVWAWERPENLEFIDNKKVGVAFLAQTLQIKDDKIERIPRRQPLKVPPETQLIAVTRIETDKNANLNDPKRQEMLRLILATLELKNVSAIQIDFDAAMSEREFYRQLLQELRPMMPPNIGLTMTALASWCIGDTWIRDLPVDEAVPMAFDMGADDKTIRDFLASGADWQEPLCRMSYGISVNEPLKIKFKPNRKLWVFTSNPNGWSKSELDKLNSD